MNDPGDLFNFSPSSYQCSHLDTTVHQKLSKTCKQKKPAGRLADFETSLAAILENCAQQLKVSSTKRSSKRPLTAQDCAHTASGQRAHDWSKARPTTNLQHSSGTPLPAQSRRLCRPVMFPPSGVHLAYSKCCCPERG